MEEDWAPQQPSKHEQRAPSRQLPLGGFRVTGTGDVPGFGYASSVIEYSSAASLPAVNTLEKQLTSVTLRRDPSLAPGVFDLILGTSFTALAQQSAAPHPSSTTSVAGLAQSYGGITGGASCKSDAGAFAGPLSPGG